LQVLLLLLLLQEEEEEEVEEMLFAFAISCIRVQLTLKVRQQGDVLLFKGQHLSRSIYLEKSRERREERRARVTHVSNVQFV